MVCQNLLYFKILNTDSQKPMEKALKIDLVVISSLIITVKIISAVTLNLIQFFLLVTNLIIF